MIKQKLYFLQNLVKGSYPELPTLLEKIPWTFILFVVGLFQEWAISKYGDCRGRESEDVIIAMGTGKCPCSEI